MIVTAYANQWSTKRTDRWAVVVKDGPRAEHTNHFDRETAVRYATEAAPGIELVEVKPNVLRGESN